MEDWPDEQLLAKTPAMPAAFAVFYRARRKLALPRLEVDDDLVERIEALGPEARALELLERLPPDQADAVRARVLDQRSYKDIAASVRVSEAVVRKRVSRGLLTLRGFARGG